jgi:hypothetical protein
VVAFCRMDDREIRLREPIMQPDAIIIQDATLLHQVDVFSGLKKDGYILINTTQTFEQLGLGEFVKGFQPDHLLTVPAIRTGHETRAVGRCPTCRCWVRLPRLGARPVVRRAAPRTTAPPRGAWRSQGWGHSSRYRRCTQPLQKFKGAVAKGNQAAAKRGLRHRDGTGKKGRRPTMLEQCEGSHAVARRWRLSRPEVICAYPISPQTHIVEGWAKW